MGFHLPLANMASRYKMIIGMVWVLLVLAGVFSPQGVLAAAPQRIVSLSPAATETMFALGAGKRLVGITTACDRPAEVKNISRVGGMANPSLETILSLKPDLVIMTPEGNPKWAAERLQRFGVPIYIYSPARLAEVPAGIRALGERLGVTERAKRLAGELETALNNRSKFQPYRGKKGLFVIWAEPLLVAGPRTFMDDAFALEGVINIAADGTGLFPRFSLEEVIRRKPDVVIFGGGHIADQERQIKKLIKRLRSASGGRVPTICFAGDGLYRPGPRLPDGIRELDECLSGKGTP